ncbi:RcnB family protein [Dyella sp. BiH032]|uniref:RcnB family protein n=1 Tax=Dyella sp. BiH032 TaxID=3075430 RepID=UPI0028935D4A|nr:RcnB family protein [Dyella sp. BiH032]WNL45840.1 RcnB family protein [Dyella sp. BiH032]
MKNLSKLFLALGLLAGSGVALADGHGHGHGDRHGHYDRGDWGRHDHDRRDHWRGPDRGWHDDRRYYYGGHYRPHPHRWARGERYYGPVYVVNDYRYYRLRPPPYGYHWVRDDGGYLLVAIGTGIILDMVLN